VLYAVGESDLPYEEIEDGVMHDLLSKWTKVMDWNIYRDVSWKKCL
jgi:hypothetical protein